MAHGSWAEFLAMGGHGGYVWPAYMVFALVFAALLGWALHRRARLWRELRGGG